MKNLAHLILILPTLILVGCSGKKSQAPVNNQSSQYVLEPFYDINNESTLDLEELKDLPRVLNLKEEMMTSVKDQGDRGTCSFFSTIGIVEAAIKKKMKVDVNLSEEYLNYVAKSNGSFPDVEGGNPLSNLQILDKNNIGFLLENAWPYQPSWFPLAKKCREFRKNKSQAPAECFSHNSPPAETLAQRIDLKDFTLSTIDEITTNEIIEALDKYRQPMTTIVPVNGNGWPDDGSISYTEEMRKDCISQKVDCGNHIVILTGYDLDKKVFFFKNSWGSKWGKEGYGTFPFDFIDRHTIHEFALVDLNNDIPLPKNFDKKNYALKKFAVKASMEADQSIKIQIAATIDNSGLYPLSAMTKLVKMSSINNHVPTDTNIEAVAFDKEDQAKYPDYYLEDDFLELPDLGTPSVVWEEADSNLLISKEVMNTPMIKKIRYSPNESLLLKTSVNVYTDEGDIELQKFFHSIK